MSRPILDISQLGLDELHTLALEVSERIKQLEEQGRRQAFERMMELAAGVGMSPRELMRMYGESGAAGGRSGASSSGSDAPPEKLYRNPEKPKQTWSGRGRKPGWLVAWEAAGNSIDELLSRGDEG